MINQHTIFMYIDKDNIVIRKMHQLYFKIEFKLRVYCKLLSYLLAKTIVT